MIYVHKPEWYFRVKEQRDVIEYMYDDDVALSGWELRKALGLLSKGNTTIFEIIEMKKEVLEVDLITVESQLVDYAHKLADYYDDLVEHYRPEQTIASTDALDSILFDIVYFARCCRTK